MALEKEVYIDPAKFESEFINGWKLRVEFVKRDLQFGWWEPTDSHTTKDLLELYHEGIKEITILCGMPKLGDIINVTQQPGEMFDKVVERQFYVPGKVVIYFIADITEKGTIKWH